jgi:uncharacterized protein
LILTFSKGAAVSLDVSALLSRYFSGDALETMIVHGRVVAGLSLDICRYCGLSGDECDFVQEAALLHDIGVCQVNAPEIGVQGDHPYIMHGILGRSILEREGLSRHAMVCERHIGVGLTAADIAAQKLPLPCRDMAPTTVAEEIVCFADLFFSKKPGRLEQKKSPDVIRRKLALFGGDKVQIFDSWMGRFGAAVRTG